MATLSYRLPTEADAAMLLAWRRRPDIAAQMLTEVPDDLEHQKAWLRRCAERTDYVHRVMCIDDMPVGYVSIRITHEAWRICSMGVHVVERAGRVGIGAFNFAHMLNHAFYVLEQRKVVNEIMAGNDRVLQGQELLGYRHVGVLRRHVLKDGAVRDLHIFEMLAEDWAETRRRFRELTDLNGHLWPLA